MTHPAYDQARDAGAKAAKELASFCKQSHIFLVAAHDQGLVVLKRDDVVRWIQALETVAETGCVYKEESPCEPGDEKSACDPCLARRALR